MPNTREKLIELFLNAEQMVHVPYGMNTKEAEKYIFEQMADHLIANGVTINRGTEDTPVAYNLSPTEQKWISVKDRLPKPCDKEPEWSETVLFRTITGRLYSGYRNQGKLPTSFYDDDWYPPYWMDESEQIEVEDEYVTHWMHLPEPPKGE